MQGYRLVICYMLEVIRIEGPFIRIVGFFASATIAYILVSLAKHQVSFKLMQTLQIDLNVYSFNVFNFSKHD
jgi:hypothetical protein